MRYLGTWLDGNLNFKHYTSIKCKSTICNLQKNQDIHHLIDRKTCELLLCSLLLTHLDYFNGILFGCAENVIQNYNEYRTLQQKLYYRRAGDIVLNELHELHWLPIKARIEFKIITIMYQVLRNPSSPAYLKISFVITLT